MKAVMISIQPKWVEKIASGQKTIEVRKTRPKMDTPFKCYIYETNWKDNSYWSYRHKGKLGKVIGEFVCDNIYDITPHCDIPTLVNQYECDWKYGEAEHCLSFDELKSYLNTKRGYGWHISNLVIYDEPKELSEFWAYNAELNKLFNEGEDYCAWGRCETENGCTNDCDTENILHCYQCWEDWSGWCHRLTRPPQSWQSVEEKEKDNESRDST